MVIDYIEVKRVINPDIQNSNSNNHDNNTSRIEHISTQSITVPAFFYYYFYLRNHHPKIQ